MGKGIRGIMIIMLAVGVMLTACGKAETYDSSTGGSDDRTYCDSSTRDMDGGLDDQERTEGSGQTTETTEEVSTDEEMVISVVEYIEPDTVWEPAPEPDPEAEEILQDTEVLIDEERTSGESSGADDADSDSGDSEPEPVGDSEPTDAPAELDVWDMGLEWYGISYENTTRSLKLITIEGYEWSDLSYYVACACWVRATEGLWGYSDMFTAFGQDDPYYGIWMDDTVIADYAYYYLEMCYQNPTYCKYVNGMVVPSDYIYYERGIYCWN